MVVVAVSFLAADPAGAADAIKLVEKFGTVASFAVIDSFLADTIDITKYGDGLWVPGAIAHEQGGLIAGLRLPASVSHGDVLTSGDVIVDGTTGGTYDVTVGANGGRIFAARPTPFALAAKYQGGKELHDGTGHLPRDADGYYWVTGRVDDVINVSGHRLGTAEVESALITHDDVSEAAVVGMPHDIKGQGIYAYVTLMSGTEESEDLRSDLLKFVAKEIGAFARPEAIQFAPGLPKTRSGKIMRRILRKIAAKELDSLGDTSTLADPAVVDDLVENSQSL